MLKYEVKQEFVLPKETFDSAGVARVRLAGDNKGGCWDFEAWVYGCVAYSEPVGHMLTEEASGNSAKANQAALDWVTKACANEGFKLEVIGSYGDEYSAVMLLVIAKPT